MNWRLKDFLRRIGVLQDFSPEDLHNAELENFRLDQRRIMDQIGKVAEGRRQGFNRLRETIADAKRASLGHLTAFDHIVTRNEDGDNNNSRFH